jgi:hypothetical protein
MINHPNWVIRLAQQVLAVASLALLAGCIDSAEPLLTDAQPLLGERLNLQLYALRENAVYDPVTAKFVWQDGHYARTGGTDTSIHDFTLHDFEGSDLIAQEIQTGSPVNYAILRKLAEGTYLAFLIDESDADKATRKKFCSNGSGPGCTVTTRQAVLAFAHASAAKRPSVGGLVLLLAEQ